METLKCSMDPLNIPHGLSNVPGVRVNAHKQGHRTHLYHLGGIMVRGRGIFGGQLSMETLICFMTA